MRRMALVILFVTTCPVGHLAAASNEDVWWVVDLDAEPGLVGREIVLEGRFQGRVGANLDQIRMKNVSPEKIEFRLDADVDRKFPSNMQFIRLAGNLQRSGGKLVLQVKSWAKITTSDGDRYREAAKRLRLADYQSWNKLSERVQRLADLHGDEELRSLAAEAKRNGLRAKEMSLGKTQWEELLKLADQARPMGLDDEEPRRMRHKALRWRLDDLQRTQPTAAQWHQLTETIASLLPGARVVLKPSEGATLDSYRASPIDTYDKLPHARDACDREFWIYAISQEFDAQSRQQEVDLFQLSAEARRQVPDRPELSQALLKKWADSEASRVKTLPPASQVRRLAEVFRTQLGDPGRARGVLIEWLETRRKKLTTKDADGRVRLARDFRLDLGDQDTAAKLLLEAVEIENDLPEAADGLKELGYVRGPTGWTRGTLTDGAANSGRNTPNSRVPQVNMTADQVREILGAPRPEERIRFSDRRDGRPVLIEQWGYRGPKDLYVTFLVVSPLESRVIAISTPSQK